MTKLRKVERKLTLDELLVFVEEFGITDETFHTIEQRAYITFRKNGKYRITGTFDSNHLFKVRYYVKEREQMATRINLDDKGGFIIVEESYQGIVCLLQESSLGEINFIELTDIQGTKCILNTDKIITVTSGNSVINHN